VYAYDVYMRSLRIRLYKAYIHVYMQSYSHRAQHRVVYRQLRVKDLPKVPTWSGVRTCDLDACITERYGQWPSSRWLSSIYPTHSIRDWIEQFASDRKPSAV